MFSFFSRSSNTPPPHADMHAHWLPGVDDGAATVEEGLAIIGQLKSAGFTNLTTTPHIMQDMYGNTYESLKAAFDQFYPVASAAYPDMKLALAAEYYLDEGMMQLIRTNAPLLTFGKKYLLFETNVISEPLPLGELAFQLNSRGIVPVMAHPERYQYMSVVKAEEMRNRGILLQINLLSITGLYGPVSQRMARKLIEAGLVDFLGTDTHHPDQVNGLREVWKSKLYRKAMSTSILNHVL